jgi:outer membrane immunogenic protein
MKNFVSALLALVALVAVAPAYAADLPVKAPVPVVVDPGWRGFYVGVNVGYSWGNSDTDVSYATFPGGVPIVPPPGSIISGSFDIDGVIAGLQAGYNWQHDKWVFGIEGDFQWSGQKGSGDFLCHSTIIGGPCLPGLTFLPPGVGGTTLSLDQKLQWFGTLRGRVGILPAPTWLLYVTGGLAVGKIKTDATLSGFTPAAVPVSASASDSETNAGWTLGAGIEGVISGKWTGKIEYLYIDFGDVSGNVALPVPGIQASYTSHITDNIVRVGLNYRF